MARVPDPPPLLPGWGATPSPPVASAGGPPGPPAVRPEPQTPPPAEPSGPRRPGRTVTVVSGKGGVGASVLATNLACWAAGCLSTRTALVDLDLQQGAVRQLTGATIPTGITDIAAASPVADPAAIWACSDWGPGGVRLLLAPPTPHAGIEPSRDLVRALLDRLRELFALAVVDTPTHLTPAGLAAASHADRVAVVSGMSAPAVEATRGLLAALAGAAIAPDRLLIVLNRTEANTDLTRPAVEERLGLPAATQLPYDPVVVGSSVNRSLPFTIAAPGAQVSRRVGDVAAAILGGEAADGPPGADARISLGSSG